MMTRRFSGLLVTMPLAVVLGAQTVSWALSLKSWTPGETLTAADLNGNFAKIDAELSKPRTILCSKTYNTTSASQPSMSTKFAASDCGGTLPDANFHAAPTSWTGCNGLVAVSAHQSGATDYPGVFGYVAFDGGGCPSGSPYSYTVLYVRK